VEAGERLRINKSGYVIHGCIHRARPEVSCVIHTHTPAGMAVSAMKCGLLPLTQTSMKFVNHLGYHDYEGPATRMEERERLVQNLGPHDAMILRSHGLLACGPSIAQAFNTMQAAWSSPAARRWKRWRRAPS
jgi:ribulose-5-phosphate 4-epimerase/fuculose-1-phosphate aldolase